MNYKLDRKFILLLITLIILTIVCSFKVKCKKDDFFFVQFTDIHFARSTSDIRDVFKNEAYLSPVEYLTKAVEEVNNLAKLADVKFVVSTGDIVADANYPTIKDVLPWIKLYKEITSKLTIPKYDTIGNHEIYGIRNPEIKITDPLFGLGLFQKYFGKLYYSFNIGDYAFIALSPHVLKGKKLIYSFPKDEVEWLKAELNKARGKHVIVFCHEPPIDWADTNEVREVLGLLKKVNAVIICGHWHILREFTFKGLRIIVSGALCARWWMAPSRDGCQPGYMIYHVKNGRVEYFFKPIGEKYAVNLETLDIVLKGEAIIYLKVYPSVAKNYIKISFDKKVPFDYTIVYDNGLWFKIRITVDTSNIEDGWLTLKVIVKDRTWDIPFYVANKGSPPLDEVISKKDILLGREITLDFLVSGYSLGKHGCLAIANGKVFLLGYRYSKISIVEGDMLRSRLILMMPGRYPLSFPLEFEVYPGYKPTKVGVHTLEFKECNIRDVLEGKVYAPIIEGKVVSFSPGSFTIDDGSGRIEVFDLTMQVSLKVGDHVRVKGLAVTAGGKRLILVKSATDVIPVKVISYTRLVLGALITIVVIAVIIYVAKRKQRRIGQG